MSFPDFINNLLSTSALGVLIIPLLQKSKFHNEIINSFYFSILKISIVFIFITTGLAFMLYENYFALILVLSLISTIPNLFNVVLSSYLNFKSHFLWPSFGTLFFLIPILIAILFKFNLFLISASIILGSFIRLFPNLIASSKFGLKINIYKLVNNKVYVPKYKDILVAILSSGIFLILPIIDKIFASLIDNGSASLMSFSEKIIMIPVSLVITPMTISNFPRISKLIFKSENKVVKSYINLNYLIILALSLSVVIVLYFLNDLIVRILFGFVSLSAHNLNDISIYLNAFLVYVFFSGLNLMNYNLLYAKNHLNFVLKLSSALVIFKIILNILAVNLFSSSLLIVYSTSFMALLQFIVSYIYLLKRKSSSNEAYSII